MLWSSHLLDDTSVPAGLLTPGEAPAQDRFNVYRNNVIASLADALEDGFPTVARLVGHPFFRAMATVFIRRNPPRSPVLSTYGAAFPSFIETFAPAATVPYLADCARLDRAILQAYHAADAVAVDKDVLRDPRIGAAQIGLAPAVRVLSSRYPLYSIWRANRDALAPKPSAGAETVLVSRPDWDPLAERSPSAEAAFIDALRDKPIGDAARIPDLDLPRALSRLIARGAIVTVEFPS